MFKFSIKNIFAEFCPISIFLLDLCVDLKSGFGKMKRETSLIFLFKVININLKMHTKYFGGKMARSQLIAFFQN